MTAVIQKWGNSQGIRIPKSMIETLEWKIDDEITIKTENNRIIIEKAKKRKTISELFDGYDGDYTPSEIDWGEPVGEEVW